MDFSAFIDRWRPSALRAAGRAIAPGVASTLIVALAATYLSDHYHAPPVIFALLLGMALNQLSAEARYAPGINVSARTLLRISVAFSDCALPSVRSANSVGRPPPWSS
jgi:uncharacterized membrane protein YadS